MSSPICISDDDDSFDLQSPPEKSSVGAVYISSDEDDETPIKADVKEKRQTLIRNLFPSTKINCDSSRVIDHKAPVEKQPDFVKVIGGVTVHLPVNPYPCQIAVMFKVITAIEKKKNCLLESPTGTGKTLALLCSALSWLKREQDRIRQEQASTSLAQHPELSQLDGALEYIASPKKDADQSPEAFFSKRFHGEKSIYDSPQKQNASYVVNKRQEPHNDSFDSPPNDGLVNLQKKMRYNSESPLTSPELPSTPEKFILPEGEVETPQKIRELYTLVENLRFRATMFVGCSLPTIYYGARTHKQIQQVVKEFGRTAHCGDALMSVLSAREHSCIREYDRSQWPSKNDMCASCIKPLSSKEKQKCGQETNCKYYDNRKSLNWKALPPAFDLKDLVTVGEIKTACPYYAAREMAKAANIVFCPYNYLIEPSIRKSMQIDLSDNVVIIDEGHNIEDICRDAATCNFTREQVNGAIKELETVVSFRFANQGIMPNIEKLLVDLKNWDQWFGNQTPLINNQVVNGTEATFTWQVENFVETLNNHNIGQKQYNEFHQNVEVFCRKFREDNRTLIGVTQSTCSLLESLDTVLGYLFRCSGMYMDDFKPVLVRKLRSEVHDASAWRTSQFDKLAEKEPLTLRLICLNPAVVFAGLRPARCVILASGTLTPMVSMQSELATDFPLKISPKHIIPSDRVWIGSLLSCPDGSPLECTSYATKQTSVQDALGQAVYEVCRVTPHGVLCFFPSYQRMNVLVRRWQQIGLWRRLKELKHIFIESNDAKDHDSNMEEYYECVGSAPGALLLAVYRGKVAEGMDFKDHQARAVITVGVPYPNKYDIAVSEKMKYNDKYRQQRKLLSGTEWYLVQAYRALNQAVGRCVRHRGDWGAVLLLDARFRDPHYTQHLSAWVKEYGTTSSPQESQTDGGAVIRQAFISSGVNEEAADIMLASISQNTLKQYKPCILGWSKYCKDEGISLIKPSISNVISYLTKKYQEGLSYGSLNALRSALSLIIGSHLGNDDKIKRLFRGFFKLRPTAPKYYSTWDVSIVLNFIDKNYNDKNNLVIITKKTATLLILATGQRVQTISLIDINNIVVNTDCINIKIDKLVKTSAPNKCQPYLTLPFFKDRVGICPARALCDYLEVTQDIRTTDSLFVSLRKPFKSVSTSTISRWIKRCMEESGIDVSTYTTHSTRHATTSAAYKKGVNIDDIRRTAGWTGESTVFGKFYNRPIINNNHFAETVFSDV